MSTKSKIKFFKTLVNGWKPLTNDTKSSIFGVAGALDMLLKMYFVIGIYQHVNYTSFRAPLHCNCKGVHFQYSCESTASNFTK